MAKLTLKPGKPTNIKLGPVHEIIEQLSQTIPEFNLSLYIRDLIRRDWENRP